ncbi:uncharacterized protein LOC143450469 isoform X1 [Clavelina lepadiformis]|uniref:uncharacterized protein LOC143450469 isoform X1 n=1 Tax=Clavelina lepadiformis TaxID=159417 RepID=UPI004041679D
MKTDESKWSVIANGKHIANGTTVRRNGVVTHTFVTSKTESNPANSKVENIEQNIHEDDDIELEEFSTETRRKEEVEKATEQCAVLKVNTSGAKTSHEALSSVIRQLKWRECRGNCKAGAIADIYWHGIGYNEALYNKPGVYAVNKLPGMAELSQKIHLSRIVKRMQMLYPGEFDFYPPTWFLPEQYHQFIAEVSMKTKKKANYSSAVYETTKSPNSFREFSEKATGKKPSTYIVKPDNGSQGEGIFLVNDLRDVQSTIGSRPAVVQRYIENPLLIDKFKFDLRLYVLVARLHPVEIYLCKDGLARLCTVEYEQPNSSNIHNAFMHLTNYSLNKNSDYFVHTDADNTGSKRSYRSVIQVLQKQGHDVDKIHKQIVDLVVKTVLSLLPDITIWDYVANKSRLVRCFQILGFDILLTSDLQAHLLEVNSSPSMGIDAEQETELGSGIMESVTSIVDEQIKVPLLRDTVRVIAYGERQIDMEKSCLQRVYPLYRNKQHNQDQFTSGKTTNNAIKRTVNYLSDEHDSQYLQNEDKSILNDVTETTASLPEKYVDNSYAEEVKKTPDVDSIMTLPPSDTLSHCFENPFLRADIHSRARVLAKRPSKFTVVKYRQEYAISMDEWKFIEGRRKTSSLHLRNTNDFKPKDFASLRFTESPRNRFQPQVQSFAVKDEDELVEPACCYVCGNYIGGYGPGLVHTQKQHKVKLEKQQSLDVVKNAVRPLTQSIGNMPSVQMLKLESQQHQETWDCEWESERRNSTHNPLPPRSIYFNSAQNDIETSATLHPRPPSRSLLSQQKNEGQLKITQQRRVCDSCVESSSTASTGSPDIDYEIKRLPPFCEKSNKAVANDEPTKTSKSRRFMLKEIMLINRVAAVFIYFNGVKRSLRINATAFRNMARNCKLCDQGAMPAIDILFIDVLRQCQQYASEQGSPFYHLQSSMGLPFQGFLEAMFRIAKARFKGATLKEKLEALVSNCELYMQEATRANKIARRRLQNRVKKKAVVMSPRISCGLSQRQPYF